MEFSGCTSDPGIIDPMKSSPEKIYLKALNEKAELSYSPFGKEREPPFIFVYFLAQFTYNSVGKNKNSLKKSLKLIICQTAK